MILCCEDKLFVKKMLEISTNHYVKMSKEVINSGTDIIFPADDVAFRTGLFIPLNYLMRSGYLE